LEKKASFLGERYGIEYSLIILMGVPSYFKYLVTRYKDRILHEILPRDKSSKTKKNVLYLDFNGAIHPAVREDINLKKEDMNKAVCLYLDNIVEFVKPDELYIAIDGVAPRAKMEQQRERRYKSAKESLHMREISVKYKQPVRVENVDFNMISPGTQFMLDLQIYLERHIQNNKAKNGIWRSLNVILDGSGLAGEGEHKIMTEIRKRRKLGVYDQSIVYGLDADLIFLSTLNDPDIVLVRENGFFDKENSFKSPYLYLDIRALSDIIVEVMSPCSSLDHIKDMGIKNMVADYTDYTEAKTSHNDSRRLLVDYAYICYFLGNDFLPRLPCLRIRDDSLNDLIVFYKIVSWKFGDYLVTKDYQINIAFLNEFIYELSLIENELLCEQVDKRMSRISKHNFRIRTMTPYEREKEKFTYVEDQYVDTINEGSKGWRIRYYNHHLGIIYRSDLDFRDKIDIICNEYIRGTVWVLHYYVGKNNNWSWDYPYLVAPSAQDLSNILSRMAIEPVSTNIVFLENKPVTPFVQLMSILPPDSAHLMPKALENLMTTKDSVINYMYPIKFKISYIGNKFWHECKPILPYVDQTLLTDIVKSKEVYFTEMEKLRNSIQQVKYY